MSRSRRTSGGSADKALWFLVVAGLVVGFFAVPYDPGVSGIVEVVKSKAETVQKWAAGVAPGVEQAVKDIIEGGKNPVDLNPGGGTAPAAPGAYGGVPDPGVSTSDAVAKVASLKIGNADGSTYDRDEWNHWINQRSCWDTREAVLARDAVPGSLKLTDKNGAVTSDVNVACAITGGEWKDPYTGRSFTNPKDLDIDHVIALGYAGRHGGNAWDEKKKEQYANSMDATHLLAVEASANRSKSDKGPSEWKPANQAYWCDYGKTWVKVASSWGLTVTQADANSLKEMVATCK